MKNLNVEGGSGQTFDPAEERLKSEVQRSKVSHQQPCMLHEECHEELVTLMKCNCEGYRVDDKNCLSNAEEIERRGKESLLKRKLQQS
jgi:hypothetical protein